MQLLGAHSGRILDLEGPEAARAIHHEIDLNPSACTPEIERTVPSCVGDPGPEVLSYQPLKGAAVNLFGAIKWPARTERAIYPGVEEVEFRVCAGLAPRPLGKDRQAKRQQQVL